MVIGEYLEADLGMDAYVAAGVLSAAGSARYEVVGALTGGETGATEVARSDGERFVLKWELDPENQAARLVGVELAERLRVEAAWPVAKQQVYEIDGCLIVLQEFMPGSNVEHSSHALVDDLLELHERRLLLSPAAETSTWATDMLDLLVLGGNGYCLHEPLRGFDARTRRVIERIEEIGRTTSADDIAAFDIVHGDLHYENILQLDGRLCAVVDLDCALIGDAAFDLTMLAITSLTVEADSGVRSRLFEAGVTALPEAKRLVYAANILLRCLDWAIRKSRLDEVEFWLSQTDRLLET